MHEKVKDKVQKGDYLDFHHLIEDWTLLRKFYHDHCKGPALLKVSDEKGFSIYKEDVIALEAKLNEKTTAQISVLTQSLTVA